MAIAPGTRLGPYEILAPIGAGGMGEVYRAKDPRLGREVAIKVLPASFSSDPDRLRRFEQEAKAAGLLNHPNITAVYDIGTENQAPYVVTELLEGETLRGALAGGKLSPRKAVDYALQIAHGLAAAHEKGIVHRDLKPENLFVTKDGRVKILDFGLAKLTHRDEGEIATNLPTASAGTEPGVVLGTLGYMSPEQVRGRPADARSDIFSFGAILYEMLSGKRAFAGDSAADTMSAILKEDPPDLSVTNQNVSPGLERVIRHCLEKNPEQRFHSAHDLAFDLEALSGASAPALSPLRPSSRSRLLPAVAALAFVAVLAAAAGFFAARREPAHRSVFPTFRRATFRRGIIRAARFAPDGQTIVYSAAWDGNPFELFTTRVGAVESRSLSLPSAWVLAISSAGEMAIRMLRPLGVPDVLARVSLAGGATREVLEGVVDADWAPDAKSLGVLREIPDQSVALEFPIGKRLFQSPTLQYMRISPRGGSIAITDFAPGRETVRNVDLQGKTSVLVSSPALGGGIAWTPDGREIWFSQISKNGPPNVWAVDLRGRTRPVLQSAAWLIVHDIAADGKVLLTQNGWRAGVAWTLPGQAREQEVSWLDWSSPADLSGDGKTLLFSENREGGGERGSVFLRRDPSQPAVRLGDGAAFALSLDGKWALTGTADRQRLVLLPTGAGDEKSVPTGALEDFSAGAWLPDGRRIVVSARERGKRRRLFLIELPAGAPRAISPEGAQGRLAISPDGNIVAVRTGPAIQLWPVHGGSPRPLPGSTPGEAPIRWSADGSSLYVYRPGPPPVDVYRIHAATGARELWKQIAPADPAGVETVEPIVMTPDASSWVQGYRRRFSDLYVVEGLK